MLEKDGVDSKDCVTAVLNLAQAVSSGDAYGGPRSDPFHDPLD
jgi:hypothetical protein